MGTISIEYPHIPSGTKWILIACVSVFVLQSTPAVGGVIYAWGLLVPSLAFGHGQVWRAVTYLFMHGGWGHLFFNLISLWMVSGELERLWGTRRFLIFYFVCGIGSAAFSALMWNQPVVGASGALFGLFVAYGLLFPDRTVLLFFIVPVPARVAVFALFLVTFLLDVNHSVAHVTHLGGIVVGFAYLRIQPWIEGWLGRRSELRTEKSRRTRAEQYLARERYFTDVVDPILKKISETGMESLTRKEKSLLAAAAKTDKDRLKRRKVIPLELFRK